MAEISKTKAGTWQVRVFLGRDATGRKIRHTETCDPHEAAKAYAAAKETERNRHAFVEPSKESLGAYVDRYLDGLSADGTRKRTVHGYRALVRRWIHLDQRKKGSRTGAKGRAAQGCPNLGCLAIQQSNR